MSDAVAAAPEAPAVHTRRFQVRRLPGAPLGAEILGLNDAAGLSDADVAGIRQAWLAHDGLLVFRDVRLAPRAQVDFSRRFGPLQVHVLNQFHLPAHPEILVVSNVVEHGKPIGLGDAGRDWHSDLSYTPRPSLGSLLLARELPREGGDTLFANMVRAYETLPAELKRSIDGRRAMHSYVYRYERLRALSAWRPPLTQAQRDAVPPVDHPVVRTHPETGRRALFVNEGFTSRILGLPEDESAAVLAQLFAHSIRPDNIYTHRWQPGDMLFWDNRSTVHFAPGCPDMHRRTLHRTTIEGDVPV
ncbi:TauD/TfdA dioxygenase family protein [Ralstonia pseudosolanacearum]|uniref:Putative alpha-ketoglutarate-dependent taurine dioxygenase oxidoreductase protein n=1 Tax=Ralstonia solanacearum TaxID=305 RepID=A0A0S4TT74_RALSL|nr:TauD/TfdA family dioxygenase [Ralstonia pseudosolanacearum]OAI79562.1 taurine dioxygenase [Ralstonia solanacearum]QCX47766.1 TauD/TfdA family dioxygenase [Ralstonia pseudosolanacearum]CUV13196.1 putative alpha-ketoglutarate-dependent taurine dioxygenase oxidoreductase protein [Ralstonia solanacearum]